MKIHKYINPQIQPQIQIQRQIRQSIFLQRNTSSSYCLQTRVGGRGVCRHLNLFRKPTNQCAQNANTNTKYKCIQIQPTNQCAHFSAKIQIRKYDEIDINV